MRKPKSPTTRKKQTLSERVAKSWPFTKVDPRLLARAHKQHLAQEIINTEQAPF